MEYNSSNQEETGEISKPPRLEIKQIMNQLMEKYQVYNYQFAYEVAVELYRCGIRFNMFLDKFYLSALDLDEIVLHIIHKKKMITISTSSVLNSEENFTNSEEKCLKIEFLSLKRKQKIKSKYPLRKEVK